MTLLKALFWEWGLSSGWKPKIYDRTTTTLVHCYLFGGVAFGEAKLLVLSWWCYYCCFKEWITVASVFFFVILLAFWLYASVMSLGQCVVVEARCNWCLRNINICSLSKKLPAIPWLRYLSCLLFIGRHFLIWTHSGVFLGSLDLYGQVIQHIALDLQFVVLKTSFFHTPYGLLLATNFINLQST
jgi:hypothetical protein